MNVTSTHCRD